MDRNDFYEDDYLEDQNAPAGTGADGQEADRAAYSDDDTAELFELLNFLSRALNEASPVPLSNKRMVNVDMCLDIVNNIRECLPQAVQYAMQVLSRRDRILDGAKNETEVMMKAANARANSAIQDANARARDLVADAEDHAREIIEDANARARAMVDNSEIVRNAREAANSIDAEARAEAGDRTREAANYVDDLLRELERDVQATLDAVRRSRKNITGGN